MDKPQLFVILASNSASRATVYGGTDGKPYTNERTAGICCQRLKRNYPTLDFLVLPLTATDALMIRPASA